MLSGALDVIDRGVLERVARILPCTQDIVTRYSGQEGHACDTIGVRQCTDIYAPPMSESEKWYVAVVVLQATSGAEWQDDRLLDHQIRLIRASDAEVAYTRALVVGAAEAHAYPNSDGQSVTWEFLGLADLEELAAAGFEHGSEVYSWRSHGDAAEAVLPKERLSNDALHLTERHASG